MSAQLEQEIRQLTSQLQQFVQAQSSLTNETRRTSDAQRDTNDELTVFEDELSKTNKKTKIQNDLYNKAISAKQKELNITQRYIAQTESLKELNKKIAAGEVDLLDQQLKKQELVNKLEISAKSATNKSKQASLEFNQAAGKSSASILKMSQLHSDSIRGIIGSTGNIGSHLLGFGDSVMSATRTFGPLGAAVATFIAALTLAFNALHSYTKNAMQISKISGGSLEGTNFDKEILRSIERGFNLGIDPVELAKMSAEVRQTTNALGGIDASLNRTSQAADRLYALTGDLASAQQLAFHATNEFAMKGIMPTTKALNQYVDDLYTQGQINGMGVEETKALFDGMSSDADMIGILRKAREDEREGLLANQRALFASNTALGMFKEQAVAAGKSVVGLLSAKPKERFIKAAKIQAYAGALGLGTEGAIASSLVRRGVDGGADQAALSNAMTNLTNASDKLAGSSLQSEFLVSALQENLGVESEFGPQSAFSATLGNIVGKPLTEIRDMFVRGEGANVTREGQILDKWAQQAEILKQGNLLMGYLLEGFDKLHPIMSLVGASLGYISDGFKLLGNFGGVIVNGFELAINKLMSGLAGLLGFDDKVKYFEDLATINSNRMDDAANNFINLSNKMDNNDYFATGKINQKQPNTINPETKPEQTIETNKKISTYDNTYKTAEATSGLLDLSEKYNTKLDNQVAQLNQSNNYLKIIAENTPILVDIAQKQLAATTMTEQQRSKYMSQLSKSNNKLAAEYATIN